MAYRRRMYQLFVSPALEVVGHGETSLIYHWCIQYLVYIIN